MSRGEISSRGVLALFTRVYTIFVSTGGEKIGFHLFDYIFQNFKSTFCIISIFARKIYIAV